MPRVLVTDVGGITAHGSIVAREYGIPAVLGVGDITKRLSSGQTITVDGDAGTVTIEDDVAVLRDAGGPCQDRAFHFRCRGHPSVHRPGNPAAIQILGEESVCLDCWARPFKAAFYQVLLFMYFKLTGPSGGPAAPAAGRRQARNRTQPPRP